MFFIYLNAKYKKKIYKYALNNVDVASRYKGFYQLTIIILHYITLHYITLHYIILYYILFYIILYYIILYIILWFGVSYIIYLFKIHLSFLTFPNTESWRSFFSYYEIEIIYVAFVSHEFILF